MSDSKSGVEVYGEFASTLSDLVRTKEELAVIRGNPDLDKETNKLENKQGKLEKKVSELADTLKTRYDIEF